MFVVALVALGMILLRNPTWIAYELSNEPGDELESTIIEDIKRGLSENIASGFDEDAPVVEGGGVDVREFSSRVEEIAQHYDFSPRQTEIFAYLTRGHKADFIANKLFISPNTVRTHVANHLSQAGDTHAPGAAELLLRRAVGPDGAIARGGQAHAKKASRITGWPLDCFWCTVGDSNAGPWD